MAKSCNAFSVTFRMSLALDPWTSFYNPSTWIVPRGRAHGGGASANAYEANHEALFPTGRTSAQDALHLSKFPIYNENKSYPDPQRCTAP